MGRFTQHAFTCQVSFYLLLIFRCIWNVYMIYLVRTAGHREQIRGQTRGASANHKIILFNKLGAKQGEQGQIIKSYCSKNQKKKNLI